MHLASINTAEEQRSLEEHVQAYGNLLFSKFIVSNYGIVSISLLWSTYALQLLIVNIFWPVQL